MLLPKFRHNTIFLENYFPVKRIWSHVPTLFLVFLMKSFSESASHDVMSWVALPLIYAEASLSEFQIWKWQYVPLALLNMHSYCVCSFLHKCMVEMERLLTLILKELCILSVFPSVLTCSNIYNSFFLEKVMENYNHMIPCQFLSVSLTLFLQPTW